MEYGEEYNICPELLMAIIEYESRGQADAENGNCKGLMQINVKYHEERMERLGVTDIFDEHGNVYVGSDYLSELSRKYDDIYMILMCYGMGEERAKSLLKKGIYKSSYAVEVCERSAELERLHGK